MDDFEIGLIGTKIVEVPYFASKLTDTRGSVLIVGERHGGTEGVSETVKLMGFDNVTTTDILPSPEDSWLRRNTNWKHIQSDFIEFDELNSKIVTKHTEESAYRIWSLETYELLYVLKHEYLAEFKIWYVSQFNNQ